MIESFLVLHTSGAVLFDYVNNGGALNTSNINAFLHQHIVENSTPDSTAIVNDLCFQYLRHDCLLFLVKDLYILYINSSVGPVPADP